MNTSMSSPFLFAATSVVACFAAAAPITTSFTYQGRLLDAGILQTRAYDFIFELVDPTAAAPQPTLASVSRNDLPVTAGMFTTNLDFPAGQFVGDRRAVRVRVRLGTSVGAYTTLPGLQEVTAQPYSLYSLTAASALTSNTTLGQAYTNGRTINVASSQPIVVNAPLGQVAFEGLDTATSQRLWELGNDDFGDSNGQLVLRDGVRNVDTILFDGSDNGSGAPFISFSSSVAPFSAVTFNMGAAGNGSVSLPSDAISAFEIFDEPGVAANRDDLSFFPDPAAGYQTVLARTINAPSAGFVLAVASGYASINHVSGTGTSFTFGVSLTPTSVPSAQDTNFTLSSSLPSGTFDMPFSTNEIFAVPAGVTTVYFNVDESAGGLATIADSKLSLIFVPTSYGLITDGGARLAPGTPDNAVIRGAMTYDEINAERYASWQADQARIQAELEAMRLQVEELRAEMRKGR